MKARNELSRRDLAAAAMIRKVSLLPTLEITFAPLVLPSFNIVDVFFAEVFLGK